jgi:signal transduction histidine kinase
VFTRSGNRLDEDQRNLWRQRLKEHWQYSYVLKVLQSGKASAWSQKPEDLPVDDVGLPGRQGNQKTRAQSVIVVRPENGGHPDAMIALLFQHRHAVSEPMVYQLAQLGRLLASLLRQEREFRRLFGLNTIAEQEAMLGRVFGQFRHTLKSQVALIGNFTEAVAANRMQWAEASEMIKAVVQKIERDISTNQTLVKKRVNERVNLGILWNEVKNDLGAVATQKQGHIETNDKLTNHHIWTDSALLKSILHNLVDNALRHGGDGVQVSVEFLDQGGPPSIRIRDNGKGIAKDIVPGLFQLAQPSSKESTGMGLYLAHERAAILGADLRLENTSSEGTCFLLSFTGARS